MTEWGRKRYITPGIAINGELITTDLVEINLAIRILLGSSYFDGWENERTFVTKDPLGNPVDKNHPWNKVTLPKPQKRDFTDKYTWVVSPRIYDKRTDTHVCCDTGGGPFARQWCTAKAGLVDFGYVKATGHSLQMVLPRSPNLPEMEMEWHVPEKSNAIERDRARTYHQAYSALIALHNLERAMKEVQAGRTKSWNDFKVPDHAVSVRLPRGGARRALAPHGDRGRQDRELPAVPADAVERQPAGRLRDSRPLRGRGAEHADLRGERPGELQGRRHHAGGPLVRSRACRAACTCTAARGRCARWSTRPRRSARRMEPEQLIARVQELTGRLEDLDDPACRGLAEELTAAVVQMYGAGLERIVELADAETRDELASDEPRRGPAADPRPLSRSRSRSG